MTRIEPCRRQGERALAGKTPKASFPIVASLVLLTCGACHSSGSDSSDAGAASYGADAVGIAECDDYLTTYERCVDKAPSEQRKAMRENIKRDRSAWRTLASDPGTRPGLAQACRLARDTARTTTQSYGCTW